MTRRRLLQVVPVATALGIAVGFGLHHVFAAKAAPPLALPALHGQAVWGPGVRGAPSVVERGRTVILAFDGASALERSAIAAAERLVAPSQRATLVFAPTSHPSGAVIVIDKRGFERAGFTWPFLPQFVADDLRMLAREAA